MGDRPSVAPETPKAEAPKKAPKAETPAKPQRVMGDMLVRVRAVRPYSNGMVEYGTPPWHTGEVREIPLRAFNNFQGDAPGNFEILDE